MARDLASTAPSTDAVLECMDSVEGPVVTVEDVRIVCGCGEDVAQDTLETLETQGVVASRQLASDCRVWWRPDSNPTASECDPISGPTTNAVDLIEADENGETGN